MWQRPSAEPASTSVSVSIAGAILLCGNGARFVSWFVPFYLCLCGLPEVFATFVSCFCVYFDVFLPPGSFMRAVIIFCVFLSFICPRLRVVKVHFQRWFALRAVKGVAVGALALANRIFSFGQDYNKYTVSSCGGTLPIVITCF